jgi:hypothetical protein
VEEERPVVHSEINVPEELSGQNNEAYSPEQEELSAEAQRQDVEMEASPDIGSPAREG